jgi:mucin-19
MNKRKFRPIAFILTLLMMFTIYTPMGGIAYADSASSGTTLTLTVSGSAILNGSITVNVTASPAYNGELQLVSSSPGSITLPTSHVTISNGYATFIATASALGSFWIRATDVGNSSVTGATNSFDVGILGFNVEVPNNTYGDTVGVTVTAIDALSQAVPSYRGTVVFGTSNTTRSGVTALPPTYTFVSGDNGRHYFGSSVTFGEAGTFWLSVNDQANWSKSGYANGIVVSKKGLTIGGSLTVADKVYDGDSSPDTVTVSELTVVGTVFSDSITFDSISTRFPNKNVTDEAIVSINSATFNGTRASNYTLDLTGAPHDHADITVRTLTLSSFTANNKVYDSTTSVTGIGFSNDKVSGDDLSFSYNVAFASEHAANSISVNYTDITISGGGDIGNYVLASTTGTATANITVKPVTISGSFTVDGTRVYDGTTSAAIVTNSLTVPGLIANDNVTLSAIATFADRHVGTDKTISLAASTTLEAIDEGHSDVENYSLSLSGAPTTTASITTKDVTISGIFIVASTREYNGTTSASIETNSLEVPGLLEIDNVTLSAIASFADRHVGTGKTVSLAATTALTGINATNYLLSMTNAPTTTAGITAKPLTITAIDMSKVYDGGTPGVFGITHAAVAYSDDLTKTSVAYSGTAVNATRAGIYAITPSNVSSTNYIISYANGTLTISPKALTVTGAVVTSKVYDGTTTAAITGATLSGIVSGDTVTLSNASISSFASKDVGTGIAVTSSAMTIEGIDAANYSLTYPILTGNITSASTGGGGLGGGGGGAVVVEPPVVTPPATTAKLKLEFNIGINNSYLTTGSTVKAIQVMDIAPVIVESRTLLPIRFVVEPLGGTIAWNEPEQKVTIIRGSTTIELWIGNNMASINGVLVMIDPSNPNVKPFIIDPPGRTMLPLRFISEALGCTVEWNEPLQLVTITEL